MNGLLIFNKYYSDEGQRYIHSRLTECFSAAGVRLLTPLIYAGIGIDPQIPAADFAVFWDKDIALARQLEQSGMRVYNCSHAIELCDNKRKTYQAVAKTGVPMIPTLFAPLAFLQKKGGDPQFLDKVIRAFGYPIVVKEDVGSQGKQVYLAHNRAELEDLHTRLFTVPHQFQPLFGIAGQDVRVYTIGEKALAAVRRKNSGSFVSNAANGGVTEQAELTDSLKFYAETLARTLRLDYAAIDFLQTADGQFCFLEANSNAYFAAAEQAGIEIAESLVRYLCANQSKKI